LLEGIDLRGAVRRPAGGGSPLPLDIKPSMRGRSFDPHAAIQYFEILV